MRSFFCRFFVLFLINHSTVLTRQEMPLEFQKLLQEDSFDQYIKQSPENIQKLIDASFYAEKNHLSNFYKPSTQALIKHAINKQDFDLIIKLLASKPYNNRYYWSVDGIAWDTFLTTIIDRDDTGFDAKGFISNFFNHVKGTPLESLVTHEILFQIASKGNISRHVSELMIFYSQHFPNLDMDKHLQEFGHRYDGRALNLWLKHIPSSQKTINEICDKIWINHKEAKNTRFGYWLHESESLLTMKWYLRAPLSQEERQNIRAQMIGMYRNGSVATVFETDLPFALQTLEQHLDQHLLTKSDTIHHHDLETICQDILGAEKTSQSLDYKNERNFHSKLSDSLQALSFDNSLWANRHQDLKNFHTQIIKNWYDQLDPVKKTHLINLIAENNHFLFHIIKRQLAPYEESPTNIIKALYPDNAQKLAKETRSGEIISLIIQLHNLDHQMILQIIQDNAKNPDTIHKIIETEKLDEQSARVATKIILDYQSYKSIKADPETFTSKEQKKAIEKIQQATDLTVQQKAILIHAYKNMNFNKLLTHSANQAQEIDQDAQSLPMSILEKYAPIIIYLKTLRGESPYDNNSYTATIVQKSLRNNPNLAPLFTFQEIANINKEQDRQSVNSVHDRYKSDQFLRDLITSGILRQTIQAEQQASQSNQEPFVHGRHWSWNFTNDIWNMIQALKENKLSCDPTHIDDNRISLRYRSENQDLEKLKDYRAKLIKDGGILNGGTATQSSDESKEIVCMNQSIASNKEYFGECTGRYFTRNRSIAYDNAAYNLIPKLFDQEELEEPAHKFRHKIEQLADLHLKTNDYGEILSIQVNKDEVNKMVYPATTLAMKLDTDKSVQELLSSSKNKADSDAQFTGTAHPRNFYCLAVPDMPNEYGKKYNIKSLHCADPEKYADYKEKRNELFNEIKNYLYPNDALWHDLVRHW